VAELIREPGDWRGDPPPGQLHMQLVGEPVAGDEPGWLTVTGWRYVDDQPGPVWVTVQVRTSEAPPGARGDPAPGRLRRSPPTG
jgi:hypothetical protein